MFLYIKDTNPGSTLLTISKSEPLHKSRVWFLSKLIIFLVIFFPNNWIKLVVGLGVLSNLNMQSPILSGTSLSISSGPIYILFLEPIYQL